MVKSIIKRIIVGVGIALCLMAIKGSLFMKVEALSCGIDSKTIQYPIENIKASITNNTTGSNVNLAYYRVLTVNDTNQKNIRFNSKDSYIDIQISGAWVYGTFNQAHFSTEYPTTPMDSHLSASPPIVYLEDNTKNPNNNVWTIGTWTGSGWSVRYYKKDYPNSNTINLSAIRIAIPTWYYNYTTEAFILVNSGFQIEHYNCDSQETLEQSIQENTQKQEETNDLLSDSNTDDPSGDITSMNNKIASNGSITQLLTLPITLYQNILNATNTSCSVFQLGSMFGKPLTMPCINLQNILGGSLWSIIDILCSGLFILAFRKKMVDIFNNMTSLKDRGNELE